MWLIASASVRETPFSKWIGILVFMKITSEILLPLNKQRMPYRIGICNLNANFVSCENVSNKCREAAVGLSMFFYLNPIFGAFNLHLLEFTFIYQFYSRKTIIVKSIFWNPVGLFAFMSFHNHFKLFWYCVLLKMRGIFCPYLFWDTAKWYLNW